MRKYFDYWKIKKDKLTLTEAIKLYNEYSKSDQHKFMDVALYHSWDGKLDLHRGRLIGPYDKVIEQQQFTIAEFEATDWMLLEIDEELEKKLHTAYNYVVDIFNDDEYEKFQLRDRDIDELFDVLVKEAMSTDDKIKVIEFLNEQGIIKRHTNEED